MTVSGWELEMVSFCPYLLWLHVLQGMMEKHQQVPQGREGQVVLEEQ